MKKYVLDLTVTENIRLHANYVLIKLTQSDPLPEMLPGQFAEIRVDAAHKINRKLDIGLFVSLFASIIVLLVFANYVFIIVKAESCIPFR